MCSWKDLRGAKYKKTPMKRQKALKKQTKGKKKKQALKNTQDHMARPVLLLFYQFKSLVFAFALIITVIHFVCWDRACLF